MANFNIRDWAITGLLVAGVGFLYSWILSKWTIPTANITLSTFDINVRQQLVSGVDTSIGAKVFSYIGGVLPASGEGIAILVITGVVVALFGRLVFGFVHRNAMNDARRIMLVMLYGSLGLGLLIGTITPTLSTETVAVVVTLAIYYFLVALGVLFVAKYIPGVKIPN